MADTAAASCLTPEVEKLLLDVLADGFTVYCAGPKTAPTALVAAYEWPDCVDLVMIRDFDRIVAPGRRNKATSMSSLPRPWCGPMKAPQNAPYGRCFACYTRNISTPRTASTRLHGLCGSAGPINVP